MRRLLLLAVVSAVALAAVGAATASNDARDARLFRQAEKHRPSHMTEMKWVCTTETGGNRSCALWVYAHRPRATTEVWSIVVYERPLYATAAGRAYGVRDAYAKTRRDFRDPRARQLTLTGPLRSYWADGYRTFVFHYTFRDNR